MTVSTTPKASLLMKVQRGPASWLLLRTTCFAFWGLATALVMSSDLDNKPLALIAAWLVVAYLFFLNYWWQNKVIGVYGAVERRWMKVGRSPLSLRWFLWFLIISVIILLSVR